MFGYWQCKKNSNNNKTNKRIGKTNSMVACAEKSIHQWNKIFRFVMNGVYRHPIVFTFHKHCEWEDEIVNRQINRKSPANLPLLLIAVFTHTHSHAYIYDFAYSELGLWFANVQISYGAESKKNIYAIQFR